MGLSCCCSDKAKPAKRGGAGSSKEARAAPTVRRNAPRGGRPPTVTLVERDSDGEQSGSNGSRSGSRTRTGRAPAPAARTSRLGRAAAALLTDDDSDFEDGPVLRNRRGAQRCPAGVHTFPLCGMIFSPCRRG